MVAEYVIGKLRGDALPCKEILWSNEEEKNTINIKRDPYKN